MTVDHWSSSGYARTARFVSDLGAPLLELLGPVRGARVLDLGCGDGALTEKLAAAGADVLGVDASPRMVAAARDRGLAAELADGEALAYVAEFDAVFSNAALHWMTRPDRVIAGVARALKPGGRFVAELGGMGNIAAIRTALVAVLAQDHGIETDLSELWYFPTAEEHSSRLERAGFAVEEMTLVPRPTAIEAGMEAWLETLAAPALALVPREARPTAARRVAGLLRPALTDSRGRWWADYVRLRFRARLERR